MPLTPEEIAELTADPSPLNPLPTAGTEQLGPAGKYFDPFKSAPLLERLGAAAPLATIGFGAPSFLGKMGVAEKVAPFLERRLMDLGIGAAPEASRGNVEGAVKEGGITALAGTGLEKGGQLLRYLTSGIPGVGSAALWGKKTAGELADWFTKNVPEWEGIKNLAGSPVTGEKALFAMAKGEGPLKLSEAYDKALMAAKDLIPEGQMVPFSEPLAHALKLKMGRQLGEQDIAAMFQSGRSPADIISSSGAGNTVDARELLAKLPGSEGITRRAIREALGDYVPPEMLATYKKGMGLVDLADRGGERGFLAGERFNPARAVQMVQEHGVEDLLKRGLGGPGGPADIIRGPLREPIAQSAPGSHSMPYYAGKGLGILGAGALGYATHNPMLGVAAGGMSALYPKPYRNVPPVYPQAGPVAEQTLRAVMPGFLRRMRSPEEE